MAAHSLVCSLFHYHELLYRQDRQQQPCKFVTVHLCHNSKCLNSHHVAYGSRSENQNMLHLPILPGFEGVPPIDTSPEYYWLLLESMKEVLIGELSAHGKLKGTGLLSQARSKCLPRAKFIVDQHLLKCHDQSRRAI